MASLLSLHSVCGFHGAPSVFTGSRPEWGEHRGLGDRGGRDKKRRTGGGRGRAGMVGALEKPNEKLAVECFLPTIVNS